MDSKRCLTLEINLLKMGLKVPASCKQPTAQHCVDDRFSIQKVYFLAFE